MSEYTQTFAKFMLSAQKEYDVLCERVAAGEIPAGSGVTIQIAIPADSIDRIRFDLLAAMNGNLDGGIWTPPPNQRRQEPTTTRECQESETASD